MSYEFLFWFLSGLCLFGSLQVLLKTNPISCALGLVMAMVGIAGHFFLLGAPFLGGVQIVVYAGAVMVLFVMVLMLFDLEEEKRAFSAGQGSQLLKGFVTSVLAGVVLGSIGSSFSSAPVGSITDGEIVSVHQMARLLFTKYVFHFEVLGVLLLIIAVGTVALARSKGGTHGENNK